jgi:hypothetical protein
MPHFLIVYRRSTGTLIRCDDLGADGAAALRERFDTEMQERADADVEVVLLSASSREELTRTHSRYFKTMSELKADLLSSSSS